jgi:dolichol-phosphate mannosyltransferase
MSDEGEATVAQAPHAVHVRVRAGLSKPHNWLQLAKFCAVGGSGYAVNLCVFTLFVKGFGTHHLVAATAAFVVAVINNFWWNRHWTFKAGSGHAGFQAARFFAVSIVAFVVAASILELLVSVAGVPEVLAQAISLAVSTPLNFVGNKVWSFAIEVSRD